jgi:hypothetical protein
MATIFLEVFVPAIAALLSSQAQVRQMTGVPRAEVIAASKE